MVLRVLGLGLLAAAILPAEAMPDPHELMSRSLTAQAENTRRMVNYLFRESIARRSYAKDGSLAEQHSTDYEVIFIEGKPANRRIAVNGRPLTEEEEKAETARLRQLAEDRRNRPHATSPAEERRRFHNFPLFLKFHNFSLAGTEILDGRECWVIESKPKFGKHSDDPHEERILAATAKFWIDKSTMIRARMDVTSRKHSGSAKVREFTRYDYRPWDGDVWLITAIRAVLPMEGTGRIAWVESEQKYFNYRRFGSESKLSAVEEVAGPLP